MKFCGNNNFSSPETRLWLVS
jgi:hypothetical protein